jgi:hypothetical protein
MFRSRTHHDYKTTTAQVRSEVMPHGAWGVVELFLSYFMRSGSSAHVAVLAFSEFAVAE